MPKTLTFADRFGHEILDVDDKVENEHDSDYDPSDNFSRSSDTSDDSSQSTQSSASTASLASTDTDDSDDDDDNDDNGNNQTIVQSSVGVGGAVDKDDRDNGLDKNDDEEDDDSDYEDDESDTDDNSDDDDSRGDQKEDDKDDEGSDCGNKCLILIPDVTITSPDSEPENEDRPARSPGVHETGAVPAQSPGVGQTIDSTQELEKTNGSNDNGADDNSDNGAADTVDPNVGMNERYGEGTRGRLGK